MNWQPPKVQCRVAGACECFRCTSNGKGRGSFLSVPSGRQQLPRALQAVACASILQWCRLHHRMRALARHCLPHHLQKVAHQLAMRTEQCVAEQERMQDAPACIWQPLNAVDTARVPLQRSLDCGSLHFVRDVKGASGPPSWKESCKVKDAPPHCRLLRRCGRHMRPLQLGSSRARVPPGCSLR